MNEEAAGLNPSSYAPQEKASSPRSKFWLWGTVAIVTIVAIGGIVAGVVLSRHKSSSSSTSTGGGGSNKNSSSSDPSSFTKNPALKNSFYGFAYTPLGAILPDCGATQDGVIQDIQLLSQLTTRIRTYGSDCNVSSLVLNAIKQTQVDMTVFLGIYISDNDTVYERQRDLTFTALQNFGVDHVAGLTVGNEVILDRLTLVGSQNPNDTTGIAAAEFLKDKISDVRSTLSNMSFSKTIPVGYADAGSYFNTDILEAVDYAMANVHPWFADVTIDQSASWTASYFQSTDIDLAASTTKNPPFYIAETGWPTNSSTTAAAQNQAGSPASDANLQFFIDNFVCQANQNGTGYFFFEYMDEPWKTTQYGGVEGYWGLFDSNKQLKNITIPDCTHK
ncbi:glycoside hydrolase family 17 protein [Hydnum rufescens UP504]|uniref:glucan endo-1,3-beta-D-glucosidase n=1 Tax=Hydnum rufescens UP504 TaxID=1448309 RepID=A0A9P6DQ19_9AGAM|nr:glycoside hydrolase family 17 protein [Hydnum rufescens UP504]